MTMVVRSGAVLRVFLVVAIVSIASSARADDFYEDQLKAGKADVAGGRTLRAVDEFRVAAFGFLDRPALLSETLARLALAHNTLAQPALVSETLNRFLEVERELGAYSSAALDNQSRLAFEALLIKSLPRSELTSVPSLARLFRSDAAKVSELPPEKRAAAYEQGFRHASRDIEWPLAAAADASSRGLDEDAIRWSKRALSIDGNNVNARAMLAHAYVRRGDCRAAGSQLEKVSSVAMASHPELMGDQLICFVKASKWNEADAVLLKLPQTERSRSEVSRAIDSVNGHFARKNTPSPAPPSNASPTAATASTAPPPRVNPPPVNSVPSTVPPAVTKPAVSASATALGQAKTLVAAGKFAEATKVLLPASNADPQNREVRLALLEASSLSRDWRTASAQITAAAPFKPGEEASMFYAATALYETGHLDEARRMLAPARPRLASTPLVDYYSKMILGSSRGR
jgi:thioredoxin-like negative regulator of GroEL